LQRDARHALWWNRSFPELKDRVALDLEANADVEADRRVVLAIHSGVHGKCERLPARIKPLRELIETLERLKQRNIHLVSLTEDVNTSTPTGMLFFQLIAMLAEFEHILISERTKAGLEAARARGRKGGRPKLKADAIKITIAKQLHASNSTKIKDICHTLHISRATLYRYLKM